MYPICNASFHLVYAAQPLSCAQVFRYQRPSPPPFPNVLFSSFTGEGSGTTSQPFVLLSVVVDKLTSNTDLYQHMRIPSARKRTL
ncbi:hypothetical protein Bpfe_020309 [Biomphalaria pfeifferi]|uniref:Uncharacterized protein n=1 Tax=Biomphalaria pfeifferi TaxID=112525 RepID=A0AAD8B930_BIOPF|nr:hypothetical protein Bpfe_020309 [Biomphalaria pfeifferi]